MPVLTFDYFVDYTSGQIIPTSILLDPLAIEALNFVTLAAIAIYLCALLAFMMWTFRAAHNLRALGALELKTSPGWTVGWYFIPILSLWKPYRAGIEIWHASQAPLSVPRPGAPSHLQAWWGTSVIANILGNVILRFDTVSPSNIATESILLALELGFLLASLLLTIRFVRETTYAQTKDHTAEVFA